jgi:Eukaryotic protein of unknown function (DUF866)
LHCRSHNVPAAAPSTTAAAAAIAAQSTISVVDVKKLTTKSITAEQSGQWVPVVAFDCRGLMPIMWHPHTDFVVSSTGGTVFNEVDLSEGDWGEYDEEHDLAMSITDIEHKWETTK